MDINLNVAKNIKYYRKKLGLTQKELAEKLNLSNPSTVQKWEVGKNRLYVENLYELSIIFGIEVEKLMISHDKMMDVYKGYEPDNAYPDPIEYEGLDEVAEAYKTYLKDAAGKDKDWLFENRFIIAYNKDFEVVHGIRDFGNCLPVPQDFLFRSSYVPISVRVDDEDLIKDKIKERIREVNKYFDEYSEKWLSFEEEGKTTLIVWCADEYGHYNSLNPVDKKEYLVQRFESNPDTFYVRNYRYLKTDLDDELEGESPFFTPTCNRGDADYFLLFPDADIMSIFGIDNLPKDFSDMKYAPEFKFEVKKDYVFSDREFDDKFKDGISLLNLTRAMHVPDSDRLKQITAEINQVMKEGREDDIYDSLTDEYIKEYDILYRKYLNFLIKIMNSDEFKNEK